MRRYQRFSAAGTLLAAVMFSTSQPLAAQILRIGEMNPLTAGNFADLVRIAKAEGWPGYFGALRVATAAMGAQEFVLSSQTVNAIALQILDGLDFRKIPRYADEMDPLDVVGENAELQHEQAVEKRELDWLKTNRVQ